MGFSPEAPVLPFPSWLELGCTSTASGSGGWGESSSTSHRLWGHGGYQTIAPQLPPQHPSPPGSRGAIIEKIVGREGSPGAPRSVFIFPAATSFPHTSLLFLYSHIPIPFPCTYSLSPCSRCCFILPFLFFLPPMLLLPTFPPWLHPVFSHVVGKTSPPSILPVPNSSSSLPLQPQAVLHLLSPFLLPSPPSGHEWPRKPMRQSLPSSSHPPTKCHTRTW